jgi:hypothetical protein
MKEQAAEMRKLNPNDPAFGGGFVMTAPKGHPGLNRSGAGRPGATGEVARVERTADVV